VRGRSVRLMTVAVRPGKPNAAASGFVSGIVREPLAGQRATRPVPPDTPIALSSPRRTLEGILRAAAVGDGAWGSRTAMNLPALATTPRSMADAMDRVVGYAAGDLIDWADDPVIGAIVRSWPATVETPRANALALRPETSFDDIVRAYLASGVTAAPGLLGLAQRGSSVVIETEVVSIASLQRTVPSFMAAFIAAMTSSGWALSS
jgi:D-erythronate 2-dehydrogenase